MSESTPAAGPKWRTLERIERRVAGVLVEKAKTTPDNYPLSTNALVNGCNQKNNRFPQMVLDEGQVTDALDSLRKSGAVALIQGDGRVEKYRHLLYDWLGIDKFEMAVMAELLLRGAQTLGELRGRAARMEPIKGIAELGPIVESLRAKGLLIFLTSPGRGGVVTHNLYQPQELAKVRAEHGAGESNYEGPIDTPTAASSYAAPGSAGGPISTPPSVAPMSPAPTMISTPAAVASEPRPALAADSGVIKQLADELATLKREFAEFQEQAESRTSELRREFDDLKRQLGA